MRRIAYLFLLATLVAIPFEDVLKLPGLGTVARIFGLAAFATWMLAAFVDGGMRKPDVAHGFAYALVVWVGISLFWSADAGATLERIETFLQLLALSLLVWDLCDTDDRLRAAFQSLVVGLGIAAVSVFVNFANGVEAYYGRFAASGADPNFLAMTFALGMPLAWHLSHISPSRALRVLNSIYLPVAGVAMALTGSRGGFLAGFVAIAYILSTIRRLGPVGIVAMLVVGGAATVAVATVVPPSSFERIASVGDEITQGDLNGRAGIWLEARDAFLEDPLIGVGAGASRAVLPTGKVGHNVVITVALELGIVGLVLFVGFAGAAVRKLNWLDPGDRRLWLAVLAVWGIGSLSLSLETRKITWVLFTLVLVACTMAHERWARADFADVRPVTDAIPAPVGFA